jgi:hypothetical protein
MSEYQARLFGPSIVRRLRPDALRASTSHSGDVRLFGRPNQDVRVSLAIRVLPALAPSPGLDIESAPLRSR